MTPDDERLQQIKGWWKEFRWTIIGGLSIGIIAVSGWTGWNEHTRAQREAASEVFQRLSVAVVEANVTDARQAYDDLQADYSATVYAEKARLLMARASYDAGDSDEARALLEDAISMSSESSTLHVARIRMAQLLIAESEYLAALDLLDSADADAFASHYEELKGDAYRALGRFAEASEAYQTSIDALDDGAEYRTILTLKLNDTLVADP